MNPFDFQFDLLDEHRPAYSPAEIEQYPAIEDLIAKRSSRRVYNPVQGIRAVVIHATVLPNSKKSVNSMRQREASFHFLVPSEQEPQHGHFAWQVVPVELAAWHVKNRLFHGDVWGGKAKINHWSVGIEIVNTQTGDDPFSDWQIEMAARLVRWCWARYPNLRHVVSHAKMDPDNRSDPGRNFPWERLKERVLDAPTPALPALVARAL